MEALSDAELRAKTDEFRARLGVSGPDLTFGQTFTQGLTGDDEEDAETEYARKEAAERAGERRRGLDDLLPEAFAVVREASRRTLGLRHYDVQLIGGIVLHQGKIAEMRTGEGKTLVATLPLYLNALAWRGAHLVTVNDYLARRDAGWNAPLYHALGMSGRRSLPARQADFVYLRPRLPRRISPRSPPAASAAVHASRSLRRRHHVRHQQRARLRLSARQHGAVAGPLRAAPAALRDRGRGRLDPHRRSPHPADHQRPGHRAHGEVLPVRTADPPARCGGRLHRRREGRSRPRSPTRASPRSRSGPASPTSTRMEHADEAHQIEQALGRTPLPARPRLHRARRRSHHRRRVHRAHDARAALV